MGTYEETNVRNDIDELHQAFRAELMPLIERVAALNKARSWRSVQRIEIFECLRLPSRQAFLLQQGRTKVGPWRSAHNYGLAADFVGKLNRNWTWKVDHRDWRVLHELAAELRLSLHFPIAWDPYHCESMYWPDVLALSDQMRDYPQVIK